MAEPSSGTITAEKLSILTGLTDRRHRQLSKEGFFPAPNRGNYQLTPTIQGMFRHYREKSQQMKDKREAIEGQKLRKLTIANDEHEGLLTNTQSLAGSISESMGPLREELRRKLENELPIAMSGMSVPENRIIGKRTFDDISIKLQSIFKKWAI